MKTVLFLYILAFFSLTLGEFGQLPFASTGFSISFTDISVSGALTLLLIWNIDIKKIFYFPHILYFIFTFIAFGILSLLFSLDLSGVFYLFRFLIYTLIIYLTFWLIKSKILSLKEFFTLLKITSFVLAICGLIQIIVFPDLKPLSYLGYDPHNQRLFSTFLDPNFLGSFLTFSLIFQISELLNKKFLSVKNFLTDNRFDLIQISIISIAIILTFSRSAYLFGAISLLIIFALRSYKLLLAFLIAITLLYLFFPPLTERIQGAINIDKSASERFNSWEKGIIIFQQNPILGVGFNNIRNYSQKNYLLKTYSPDGGNSGSGIDSSLIFVLATTGIFGFLIYLSFYIKLIIDQINILTAKLSKIYTLKFSLAKLPLGKFKLPNIGFTFRDKQIYTNTPFPVLPFFAILVGFLINSFFINSLFYPPLMFIFFSLVGIFYGLGEGEGEASS